jgi:molybdopterin converting factor small subunit
MRELNMVIKVDVRFLGILKRLSGKDHFQVQLQEPATVRKLVMNLLENFSSEFRQVLIDVQLNDPRPNTLILVGGKEISVLQGLETEIRDNEKIVLVPVVHGG